MANDWESFSSKTAEMAGMSKQLVYYMVKRSKSIPSDRLQAVVEALGATMAEFYEIEFDDKKE
jgi:hypothetical protein